MSNNKDPQSYFMAAGGLAILAAGITYCATNWDNPPDWWPNKLQPWWNKKEPEPKQTSDFVKHEDEDETTNEQVTKQDDVKYVEPVTPVKSDTLTTPVKSPTPEKQVNYEREVFDDSPLKEENSEVTSEEKDLVKPSDIDVETN